MQETIIMSKKETVSCLVNTSEQLGQKQQHWQRHICLGIIKSLNGSWGKTRLEMKLRKYL